MYSRSLKVVTPEDVPAVTTMDAFVLVASYSLKDLCEAKDINQCLYYLTKGLIQVPSGPVIIARLVWSTAREPVLSLENVTGRDIQLALDYLNSAHATVCNPDPSRNDRPSVPGIKITDLENPFFKTLLGPEHDIEIMQPIQVFRGVMDYLQSGKIYGCTIPFLLGLPWVIFADNDPEWIIEGGKIDKPCNLRYLNFQFDPRVSRYLEYMQSARHEDQQVAPSHFGTFVLVHLLGVKIHPCHIVGLCEYLDTCVKFRGTPSKEGFRGWWSHACERLSGDRTFPSPYDIDNQEEPELSNTGVDASARNLWGNLGDAIIEEIDDVSVAILEDLWPVTFGGPCVPGEDLGEAFRGVPVS